MAILNYGFNNMLFPVWVIFLSVALSFDAASSALIIVIKTSFLFCFIYGVFLLCRKNIICRLLFSFWLSFDLFVKLAYESSITINVLMSVANSNSSEALEFMGFNGKFVLIAIVNFVFLSVTPANLVYTKRKLIMGIGLGYLCLPLLLVIKDLVLTGNYEQQMRAARARGLPAAIAKVEVVIEDAATRFTPAHAVKAMIDVFLIEAASLATKSTWSRVQSLPNSPDLLILAIGESLRAGNMSLYGYARNTTPKLLERQNAGQIMAYPQVYSAGPTTWTSLPASLAVDANNRDYSKSIINMAKDAGYKTYWLSNQGRYGATDRSVAAIAGQADVKYFNKMQGIGFDAVLIAKLDEVLKADAAVKRKLIVLHFYGSHMQFNQRYPQNFDVFKDGKSPLLDQYDNSVLYTDYVLDKALSLAQENNGQLMFFSDHGLRNPNGENPLTHDNRDQINIESLKVPLFVSKPTNLVQMPLISMFNFPCLFSTWAMISADELSGFCSKPNNSYIKYVDVKLVNHEIVVSN